MLNWIKFITAFSLTLITVIIVTVLYSANKPIASAKNDARDLAIQSGQITTVTDVQPYNGTTSLVTVFGKNKEDEQVAVFIEETEEEQFSEVKLNEGITAKEAMQIVVDEQKPDKVMHILLGLEDNEPIWEVAFKNESGKLNYVYIRFQDGKWSKRILNL